MQSHVVDFVEFVADNKITPEYLINNAGFGDFGYFTQSNWSKEEKTIDLSMKTLTYLTKNLYIPNETQRIRKNCERS